KHKRAHRPFWEWRYERVMAAMVQRRIESVFGWPLRITTSPNQRTLFNFSAQANGAEMLRLAAWRLCEAGIVPAMLVPRSPPRLAVVSGVHGRVRAGDACRQAADRRRPQQARLGGGRSRQLSQQFGGLHPGGQARQGDQGGAAGDPESVSRSVWRAADQADASQIRQRDAGEAFGARRP